jgi:hypothetical protein
MNQRGHSRVLVDKRGVGHVCMYQPCVHARRVSVCVCCLAIACLKDVLVEKVLQLLIGVVDAQLLKRIFLAAHTQREECHIRTHTNIGTYTAYTHTERERESSKQRASVRTHAGAGCLCSLRCCGASHTTCAAAAGSRPCMYLKVLKAENIEDADEAVAAAREADGRIHQPDYVQEQAAVDSLGQGVARVQRLPRPSAPPVDKRRWSCVYICMSACVCVCAPATYARAVHRRVDTLAADEREARDQRRLQHIRLHAKDGRRRLQCCTVRVRTCACVHMYVYVCLRVCARACVGVWVGVTRSMWHAPGWADADTPVT